MTGNPLLVRYPRVESAGVEMDSSHNPRLRHYARISIRFHGNVQTFPVHLYSQVYWSGKNRFPEIREICLQQLANALCGTDRMNATTMLMSAVRSCLYGDLDSSIDPETRGSIFDMLTNGYIPTSRVPYVVPVNNMARLTPRLHTNLK